MVKYEIQRTTPDDWWSIRWDLLEIESSAFDEHHQQDEDEISYTFLDENSINYVVTDEKGEIIGYLMSAPFEHYSEDYEGSSSRTSLFMCGPCPRRRVASQPPGWFLR